MKKTKSFNNANRIAVNIRELQELLGVGEYSALKIGQAADAVITIGRRRIFNVQKIQEYLNKTSTSKSEKEKK